LSQPGELRGIDAADEALLRAVERKGRVLVFATEGSEELRYLRFMNAHANVGGENLTHIVLKEDSRKIEILEEFLHGTQKRIGLVESLGVHGAEVHVKEFMIRHRRLLGLSDADVNVLRLMLREG
jgi:large repetitive protein